MSIRSVDADWLTKTSSDIARLDEVIVGVVVFYKGLKCLVGAGPVNGPEYLAIAEYEKNEEEGGGMGMREEYGRTVKEVLYRLRRKCADLYTE